MPLKGTVLLIFQNWPSSNTITATHSRSPVPIQVNYVISSSKFTLGESTHVSNWCLITIKPLPITEGTIMFSGSPHLTISSLILFFSVLTSRYTRPFFQSDVDPELCISFVRNLSVSELYLWCTINGAMSYLFSVRSYGLLHIKICIHIFTNAFYLMCTWI